MAAEILIRFGCAVRKMRAANHISQEQLADICGLHRTYISDIELGKRNISLENIDRIAQAFSISISELFAEVDQS